MHDVIRMAVVQCLENLFEQPRGLIFCKVFLLNDSVKQLTTIAQPKSIKPL
jgi:hypothetical protein